MRPSPGARTLTSTATTATTYNARKQSSPSSISTVSPVTTSTASGAGRSSSLSSNTHPWSRRRVHLVFPHQPAQHPYSVSRALHRSETRMQSLRTSAITWKAIGWLRRSSISTCCSRIVISSRWRITFSILRPIHSRGLNLAEILRRDGRGRLCSRFAG